MRRNRAAGSGRSSSASKDGGRSWEPVDNKFTYDGPTGTHLWYDGTPHPWEFKRVWHLEPSLSDAETVYAGAETLPCSTRATVDSRGKRCPACAPP